MPMHKPNPALTDFAILCGQLPNHLSRDNAAKGRIARVQRALIGVPPEGLPMEEAGKSQAEWDRISAELGSALHSLKLAELEIAGLKKKPTKVVKK